jgi:DNA-binding transcriptional LysR family regulator
MQTTGALPALVPLSIVADDLAAGVLTSWRRVEAQPVEVWALHSSQRLASPKVTGFISFLADQFPEGRLQRRAS